MNDLYRALGDISSIRKQVASTTEFRGYGPATLAATGVFALLAAPFSSDLCPTRYKFCAYLAIWITTAAVCCALDRRNDVYPLSPYPFRAVRRDDPHGS